MSFNTKVIYDTNSSFTSLQSVEESGQPSSITLQQLTPNQQYYTKAELYENGSLQSVSSIEQFSTLAQGLGTITYSSCTRSGYDYIVVYNYTSTYAASSAVLVRQGNPQYTYQGVIDSNNGTLTFTLDDLACCGTHYLVYAYFEDIYGEHFQSGSTTITTTTVNEISITSTTPYETSIEVDLSYVIDSGFTWSWVDWWYAYQDPETEQSQGHTFFGNGDDSVVMDNLTEGTAYKFRATITLGDGVTMVNSTVVTASTTAHDYSNDYFTVKNKYNGNNTISLNASGVISQTVYFSKDNGENWSSISISNNSSTSSTTKYIGPLPSGGTLLMRCSGGLAANGSHISLYSTYNIEVYGNLYSLYYNSPQAPSGTLNNYAFAHLFENNRTLVSAEKLWLGVRTVPIGMFENMFYSCTSLTTPPSLDNIVTVNENGMKSMFSACESLTTAPQMSNLTTIGITATREMFKNCTSLTTAPDLRRVTSVNDYGMENMFYGCTSLSTAYAPTMTWNTAKMRNWLSGVANTGTLYADSSIASGIPTSNASGCPSGWTIQRL